MNSLFVSLIIFYRKNISPIFPPCCRFSPTCSEYSLKAFKKYDAGKAIFLSVSRVLRCNPFFKGGDDPLA